jgi:tetratricopeptide (TPR) repeat protein
MTSDPQLSKRKSLEELLATLDEAEDSEGAFLQLILEGAARRDPELPELLRSGAVPRMLNVEIVGVLRGNQDDVEGNHRLLDMVSDYRFVLSRPDGGFIYHDNTRDYLLANWRSTDAKKATFVRLNESLAAFYEAKYAESRTSNNHLSKVSMLMAQANPGRLRRLRRVLESSMGASLLEALYHHLQASLLSGFSFFKTSYFELERANQAGVCGALISLTRDFLQRLPAGEGEPTLHAWLDYFDARLQRALPGRDAADIESMLSRLLDRDDIPPDLRLWALSVLAQVYESQLKLDAALRTRLEMAELEVDVDIYNKPLRYSELGALYWWIGDYPSAVRQFQISIDKVDELPGARRDMGVSGRLDLSGVYSDLGDWAAAFETATEALYRARTSFAHDVTLQRSVAFRLAQLLSTFDIRASDCANAETMALAEATPTDKAALLNSYIDVLFKTGRIRAARAWIKRLQEELDKGDSQNILDADLLYLRAKLATLEGREAKACRIYSTLLEEIADRSDSDVLRINSLNARGLIRATHGDTTGALADLTLARDECARCGLLINAADMDADLAGALLKAGDIAAAQTSLDKVEPAMPTYISPYKESFLHIKGDVSERLGQWSAAQRYYQQALDIVMARRTRPRYSSLMRKLAAVHAARSQWRISAQYDQRAGEADQHLADVSAYKPGARQQRADNENGRGMRSFCNTTDRTLALDVARQMFRSASDLDPDNLWPLLNLSFTYAEQQDWQGASEALERVLELSPAPMRTTRLHSCLRDYVFEYARQLLQHKDASRAASVVAATLDRLSGELFHSELTSLRAAQVVALATVGETAAARESCREALSLEEKKASFVKTMVSLIYTEDVYWSVEVIFQEVQHEPNAPSFLQEKAAAARAELGLRLDEILGLIPDPSAQDLPAVTPIVVEVGDALVPIVDSRQDGGAFIYKLLPDMRERILASVGVKVPGVRMRSDPKLPSHGYRIQIDEVPVLTGSVPPSASFTALRAEMRGREPTGELTDFHPLTGQPGLWVLVELTDHHPDGANTLTPARYLIHRIELVLRTNLVRYLGPQEVADLIERWSAEDDGDLVSVVLPDADARLGLTWVMQRLVDDRIPITDWKALLTTVREAGGITVPLRTLHYTIRARFRDQIPGPQTGRTPVVVPAEYEAALLDSTPRVPPASRGKLCYEFQRWLRETMAAAGPAITLVTSTQKAREVVNSFARTEHRLITTLSRDELVSR